MSTWIILWYHKRTGADGAVRNDDGNLLTFDNYNKAKAYSTNRNKERWVMMYYPAERKPE